MGGGPYHWGGGLSTRRHGTIYMDVEVDVDIDRYFGCGGSKSVQVLFHGIEAIMVL